MNMDKKFDTDSSDIKIYLLFSALIFSSLSQFLFHAQLYCYATQRFFNLWRDVIHLTIR